jgi:hypothetical protein
MKGMRIFEIDEDGIKEIDGEDNPAEVGAETHQAIDRMMTEIATDKIMDAVAGLLRKYTTQNEDKMMKYLMTFDVSAIDKIHKNIFMTVVQFMMAYTKRITDQCESFDEADHAMRNCREDALEFIDQHIDKRFAEVH